MKEKPGKNTGAQSQTKETEERKMFRKIVACGAFLAALSTSALLGVEKGGTLKIRLQSWPSSLNHIKTSDAAMSAIWQLTHIRLTYNSQEDYKEIPGLATRWETSEDFKTLTYYLNPKATFANGKQITSEDVAFSINTLHDRKKCALCESLRSWSGDVKEVITFKDDPLKIQVVMNNQHFDSAMRIGYIPIYEKARFSKGKLDGKKYDRVIEGGGPYVYDKKASKFKKTIILKKRKDHWLFDQPYWKERLNFDKIIYKYIKEEVVAFEAFKRGDLDLIYINSGLYQSWDQKESAPFDNPKVGRITAERFYPSAWGGVALNMRRGALADVNFRQALQLLMDRDLFIKRLYNNHQRAVAGPFFHGSKYSAGLPVLQMSEADWKEQDPKKNRIKVALAKAGFDGKGEGGVLYREVTVDGKKEKQFASVDLMYSTKVHDRWITMYKEMAKEYGVEINPKLTEWSAATKLLDDFKFDAMVIGWSGDVVPGPRQLFYGKTADSKGTSNYPGLKDPDIDRLIETGPATKGEEDRYKLYQELEKRIVEAQPYLFRWIPKNHYVAYWKDKLDPTGTPFYMYSGTDTTPMQFYLHWGKANPKLSKK